MVDNVKYFKAVKQSRNFQDVVDQIREAIRQGRLKLGDKLPPERELQKIFGVSRPSIREALRVLEGNGLIEVRTGVAGGAYVMDDTIREAAKVLTFLLQMEKVSLGELAEFRERLEGGTAYWAALRATEEDIQELEQIVQQFAELMQKPDVEWSDLLDLDILFHQKLTETSKNQANIAVMNAIMETTSNAFALIPPNHQKEILDDFFEILKCIKNRDAEGSERVIKKHIASFNKLMIEEYERLSKSGE